MRPDLTAICVHEAAHAFIGASCGEIPDMIDRDKALTMFAEAGMAVTSALKKIKSGHGDRHEKFCGRPYKWAVSGNWLLRTEICKVIAGHCAEKVILKDDRNCIRKKITEDREFDYLTKDGCIAESDGQIADGLIPFLEYREQEFDSLVKLVEEKIAADKDNILRIAAQLMERKILDGRSLTDLLPAPCPDFVVDRHVDQK